jgi:hypothetical protein
VCHSSLTIKVSNRLAQEMDMRTAVISFSSEIRWTEEADVISTDAPSTGNTAASCTNVAGCKLAG